jgi:hypothetical protein
MSYQDEKTPLNLLEPQLAGSTAAESTTVSSIPADRLYRIAALTAGIFLLATLL